MVSPLLRQRRIDGLRAHVGKHAELSRQGADRILRRVDNNADDVDILILVRNAHAADDILAVFVKELVELRRLVPLAYDDSDKANLVSIVFLLFYEQKDSVRKHRAP